MEQYDPESGLVFHETILKSSQTRTPWHQRCTGAKPKNVYSAHGADSLAAMAMRKTICNADTLQPETLSSVPASIIEQIWKAIRRQSRESLHVWKIFVQSRSADKSFDHYTAIRSFEQPLEHYFTAVSSVDFAWMTDLVLSDVQCSAADLKQVAFINSLQILRVEYQRISNHDRNFDDRVLGHLAHRSLRDGALRCLQLISVDGAPCITEKALESLNYFPKLDTFCVHGTSIRPRNKGVATKYGWLDSLEFQSYVNLKKLRQTYGGASWRKFDDLVNDYIIMRRGKTFEANTSVPILRASLGTISPHKLRILDLDEIYCFQKDPGTQLQQTGAPKPPPALPEGKSLLTSAPKRRKLKEGKAVALDSLLEGL